MYDNFHTIENNPDDNDLLDNTRIGFNSALEDNHNVLQNCHWARNRKLNDHQ